MAERKPWFKFHTVDWRGDAALRMCSAAARGVWIDMLTLMHESTPYGHLLVAGKKPTDAELSTAISTPLRVVVAAIQELEGRQIFDRTADGVIVSRRMVRDDEKAALDSANGKRGGNPRVKGGVNPPDNGGDKARAGVRDLVSGLSSSDLSGSETLPEGEREREPAPLTLATGQVAVGVQGVIGAWNNIVAIRPPFVRVTVADHHAVQAAIRRQPRTDWWAEVFAKVAPSDFLGGRVALPDGRPFIADFWWVLDHAEKIHAGRYDNRDRVLPPSAPTKAEQRRARNAAASAAVLASYEQETEPVS